MGGLVAPERKAVGLQYFNRTKRRLDMRWAHGVALLCALLLFPAFLLGGWRAMFVLQAFMAFVYAMHLLLALREVRRVRRGIQESDGQLCLQCGYNLPDSPNSGNCPECGVMYDIEAVRDKWRATIAYDVRKSGGRTPASKEMSASTSAKHQGGIAGR